MTISVIFVTENTNIGLNTNTGMEIMILSFHVTANPCINADMEGKTRLSSADWQFFLPGLYQELKY